MTFTNYTSADAHVDADLHEFPKTQQMNHDEDSAWNDDDDWDDDDDDDD